MGAEKHARKRKQEQDEEDGPYTEEKIQDLTSKIMETMGNEIPDGQSLLVVGVPEEISDDVGSLLAAYLMIRQHEDKKQDRRENKIINLALGIAEAATRRRIMVDTIQLPHMKPYYSQQLDLVVLYPHEFILAGAKNPDLAAAKFANAVFHELIHWTGHESRLNRLPKDGAEHDSLERAREEAVASLGAGLITQIMIQEAVSTTEEVSQASGMAAAAEGANRVMDVIVKGHIESGRLPSSTLEIIAEARQVGGELMAQARKAVSYLLTETAKGIEEEAAKSGDKELQEEARLAAEELLEHLDLVEKAEFSVEVAPLMPEPTGEPN